MTFLTLWHRPSADVRGHAAALEVVEVVARHDLDLVAGEVVQVGDDDRLLGGHLQLQLGERSRRGDYEVSRWLCSEVC